MASSIWDMMFGKGRGDNAVTQEKDRERKAREEVEAQRKKADEQRRQNEEYMTDQMKKQRSKGVVHHMGARG